MSHPIPGFRRAEARPGAGLHRDGCTRRELLARAGGGLGLLALESLLREESLRADGARDPLSPRTAHFRPRAGAVIWIFINGGPSHVDTWDYKPELEKRDGQTLAGFNKFTGFFANEVGGLMKSPFQFAQHGECGKWVSEIFPNLARHVDQMAFIHSGWTESNNHSPALFMMNSGETRMGYPCVGSWVTYGLGSESRNLPAFCVMSDPLGRGLPKGHSQNWGAGFLPSVYQGTYLKPAGVPIDNMVPPPELGGDPQRRQLDLVSELNRRHLEENGQDKELAARIESFELAYRMQAAAPEALDLAQESKETRKLYGLDEKPCAHFARQCLLARRLVERGVRFVQIYSGGMENQLSWDGHKDIQGNHRGFAAETDLPVAGLLADLKQRGLLDSTLVVWGGEFGRLPVAQKGDKPGRDHNPHAFTTWLAGGGVRGGVSYGATDEIGFKAVENRVGVHDLHATLLHLLGLDDKRLTFRHQSLEQRLTTITVEARVVKEILA
jgi:hypothetical protein